MQVDIYFALYWLPILISPKKGKSTNKKTSLNSNKYNKLYKISLKKTEDF